MLLDDLRERIKQVHPDIEAIQAYWKAAGLETKFQELEARTHEEDFWKATDHIEVSKRHQALKSIYDAYHDIITRYHDSIELIELFATNDDELKKLDQDIAALCRNIRKFKLELLLNKEFDNANCFLSINAGAGGTESQDWAEILLRMYLRFCEREGIVVDVVDYQPGEEAGIKSATLFLKKKNAYGFLKTEAGIHRLVRISPFDSNKRRHTSFAAVSATPEVEETAIQIDPNDLRIDTYRAGGKGGQHVNKTDSAVRITHIPTNIVAQCQAERSQLQNKQTAMKMLVAKLVEKREQEKREKEASIEKKKIEWGSQIRSYVLHPYKMVKDHRTDFESPQPELVLDGDIMPFIEKMLTQPE